MASGCFLSKKITTWISRLLHIGAAASFVTYVYLEYRGAPPSGTIKVLAIVAVSELAAVAFDWIGHRFDEKEMEGLRDDLEMLNRAVAPRDIAENVRCQMLELLSPISGLSVIFCRIERDRETEWFAAGLAGILKEAGIVLIEGEFPKDRLSPEGIAIFSRREHWANAHRLLKSVWLAGAWAAVNFSPLNDDSIMVVVGQRPTKPYLAPTLSLAELEILIRHSEPTSSSPASPR
jgi:hypothetical protein